MCLSLISRFPRQVNRVVSGAKFERSFVRFFLFLFQFKVAERFSVGTVRTKLEKKSKNHQSISRETDGGTAAEI